MGQPWGTTGGRRPRLASRLGRVSLPAPKKRQFFIRFHGSLEKLFGGSEKDTPLGSEIFDSAQTGGITGHLVTPALRPAKPAAILRRKLGARAQFSESLRSKQSRQEVEKMEDGTAIGTNHGPSDMPGPHLVMYWSPPAGVEDAQALSRIRSWQCFVDPRKQVPSAGKARKSSQ